jgi:hypothetical protein
MYSLYNQIQTKGLYFFCMKYVIENNDKKDKKDIKDIKKDNKFKSAAEIEEKIEQNNKNNKKSTGRKFKYVILKP